MILPHFTHSCIFLIKVLPVLKVCILHSPRFESSWKTNNKKYIFSVLIWCTKHYGEHFSTTTKKKSRIYVGHKVKFKVKVKISRSLHFTLLLHKKIMVNLDCAISFPKTPISPFLVQWLRRCCSFRIMASASILAKIGKIGCVITRKPYVRLRSFLKVWLFQLRSPYKSNLSKFNALGELTWNDPGTKYLTRRSFLLGNTKCSPNLGGIFMSYWISSWILKLDHGWKSPKFHFLKWSTALFKLVNFVTYDYDTPIECVV